MSGLVGSFYNLTPDQLRVDAFGNPVDPETYTDVVVVGRANDFIRRIYGTSMDPDSPSHPRWRLPGAAYPNPSPDDPAFRSKGTPP